MSTYNLEIRLSGPAAEIKTSEQFVDSGELARIEEPIPIAATDLLVVWQCDVSQVKVIVITADQDLTFKTNFGGSPDDQIDLKANLPYVWRTDDYNALRLTVDVTALYITNASGVQATLKIAGLYDPTP